jgi:hypothetical protein
MEAKANSGAVPGRPVLEGLMKGGRIRLEYVLVRSTDKEKDKGKKKIWRGRHAK